MAMKKKPQGKFAAGKVEAPRKVTINGETHYLVYVTPEEAKGLKKAGGSGQAGPKGIPAFPRGSVSKDKVDKAKAKMASKPAPKPKPPSGGSGGGGSDSGQANNPPPSGGGGGGGGGSDSGQANNPPPSGGNNTSTPRPPASNDNDNGPSAAEKAAAAARVQSLADAKERAKAFADAKAKAEAEAQALADSKAKAEAEAKVKAPVVTASGVASVVNPPVATGNYKPTIDPKTGAVTDRLGNPVVTNAKGYGYFDPITGLAVTPWTDSINGGGPGYGGAAFGSGGGAALDTNKDNYISEAEIAAGKAKGLALEQNAISKIGTGLGVTPLGSGIDPTGIAGFADSGILGFARKLGTPAYTRPDSSIAPGQELNKWWEADKNALGFAYGTQDEISQRRADAVRAAAAAVPERNSDNDNGPVAPTVPIVTTPPNYTANAQQAFAPIPNPNYNPADPMSMAYLTNPSYEELLAYRNSGTVPARPFAKGGIANLVKDGGNEKTIISDAIRAVEGKMSERDSAISLAKFVKAHGEPALRDLVDKVSSGEYADTRERFANGENGMVRGPGNGSGTDDKVPATIDGEQDVLLADGEMVLRKKTTDAIEKAYPGLLDRINAAEGDAPKVLAKALDFIEGRNSRG
jgi:Flp pilus assembly protein TadG